MGIAPDRHQFTVEDFHFLAENGKFAPDERLELIGGEIYKMSPIGNLHARCVNFLTNYFAALYAGKFIVSAQNPIVLNDFNQPQPDVAILRFQEDFYKNAAPRPADTVLIIEVADSSAALDRNIKLPKYAAAGIFEAWLIDLNSDRVEIYTAPKSNIYSQIKIYNRGEEIRSETLPGIVMKVDDILG